MRRMGLFSLFLAFFIVSADAATTSAQRRGTQQTANNAAAATQSSAPATSAARSAVRTNARAATTATTSSASSATAARAAAPRVTAARAATSSTTVAARAGAVQKVIGSGTTVAAAKQNVVVSEACRAKYEGCMDSFCMVSNTSGGRCICSDKNAELDGILAEIEKLDAQSYKLATEGVEKIEMGADAEHALASASAVAKSIMEESTSSTSKRRTLDLSLWDNNEFEIDEDIFALTENDNIIDGKTGDSLHRASAQLCMSQIPECTAELSMLQMMYSQQIKSDCTAYENDLKKQKNTSANRLAAAEKALREAALEQYRAANKWDLGQCTTEFKKCMATTAGCGNDFAACASVSAMDNTNTTKSSARSTKNYSIKGAVSTIEISASTYDAIMAKQPMCMNVTNSCVAVKSQVWDTFLREVAPQLKTAELIAENSARQDCIGNISACFQKACKDTMDPNDPDGSYDMCLSRPETMLNVCKIPLNACGIDASSRAKAEESQIWSFVAARLAAMRVDSCTTEVKECLQSEDRCGTDYTQCVGLDTDTIIRMCPYDKLVGCQKVYASDGEGGIRGNAVYDELATMVQGIMLNIDNSMMSECQKAADAAMIKVCGDASSCESVFLGDSLFGTTGMAINMFKADELHIIGLLNFGALENSLMSKVSDTDVMTTVVKGWKVEDYTPNTGAKYSNVSKENALEIINKIRSFVSVLESDEKVNYCTQGRNMRQITGSDSKKSLVRFPNLLDGYVRIIVDAGLSAAKSNYEAKKTELLKEAVNKISEILDKSKDISGGGMCYDKSIYGSLDIMK